MGMRSSTRKASGTKPGDLENPVPDVTASAQDQAASAAALSKVKPMATPSPTPAPAPAPASSPDSESDPWMAALGGSAPADAPGQDPYIVNDARQHPNLDTTDMLAAIPNAVEQGIPAVTSIAGQAAGAIALGGPTVGIGTGAGMEAGNVAAGAVNVAMAPHYKAIADKLRDVLGIPVEHKKDFDVRIQQAVAEAIGIALPRVIAQAPFVRDKVGKLLARDSAETVAKNMATVQAAKDQGIELGARGMMKGTAYESQVGNDMKDVMSGGYGRGLHDETFLAQQQNLDNVTQSFNRLKMTVGSEADEFGQPIIRADNISNRKDVIGAQIAQLNKKAIDAAGDKKFDPTPIIAEFKEAMNLRGITTDNGMIPLSVVNNLDNDAKLIAARYNKMVSQINKVSLENGTTLSAEQMKYLRNRPSAPGANFGEAPVPNSSAQFQDVVPGNEAQNAFTFDNTGSIQEATANPGHTNPTGVPTGVFTGSGTQGSLGMVEHANELNKVITKDATGKSVTRAQIAAQAAANPIFESAGVTNRGISLSELHQMTDDFQKLAEFDSFNRQMKQKQFGSLSHAARNMRDAVTREVFDDAAKTAEQSGNSALARSLESSAERTERLNRYYGEHADVADDFYKQVNSDPTKATENLIRGLGQKEYDNTLKVLTEKEKGALKSAYLKNLIDDSSVDGVLVDPSKMEKILAPTKDGSRVRQLFGDEEFNAMKELIGYAKTAEKIESNFSGARAPAITNGIIKTLNKFHGSHALDFFENLFVRSPKIKDLIRNTPAYEAAFAKYTAPGSTGMSRYAASPELAGSMAVSSTIPKVVKASISTKKDSNRSKEEARQIRALDLEFQ